jgi:hypothetical protein
MDADTQTHSSVKQILPASEQLQRFAVCKREHNAKESFIAFVFMSF